MNIYCKSMWLLPNEKDICLDLHRTPETGSEGPRSPWEPRLRTTGIGISNSWPTELVWMWPKRLFCVIHEGFKCLIIGKLVENVIMTQMYIFTVIEVNEKFATWQYTLASYKSNSFCLLEYQRECRKIQPYSGSTAVFGTFSRRYAYREAARYCLGQAQNRISLSRIWTRTNVTEYTTCLCVRICRNPSRPS